MRSLRVVEDVFGDGGFGDDALDGAGAVAEGGEEELAGGAEVVEPAAEGDGFADVGADGGDGRDGDGGGGVGGSGGGFAHEGLPGLRVNECGRVISRESGGVVGRGSQLVFWVHARYFQRKNAVCGGCFGDEEGCEQDDGE